MDVDYGESGVNRCKKDENLPVADAAKEEKQMEDGERDSKVLLGAEGKTGESGALKRDKRKVQWNDYKHGNKLFEVLEFLPSDSSDSDEEDDDADPCICIIL